MEKSSKQKNRAVEERAHPEDLKFADQPDLNS